MSATRSPKVSERVAPKAADPQPPKKKHDDDDGPTFAMLFHAWVEAHRASLLDSLKRLGKQPIGSFFTCLVMAVALSLPMGLSLLLNNVERLGVPGSVRHRFRCICRWMPAPSRVKISAIR